jgi:ABC-2 type transport system permease protein
MRKLTAVLLREWWINTRAYRVSFFASVFMSSLFSLLIGVFLYEVVFERRVAASFTAYAGTSDYLSYLTLGILVYTFTIRMLYPVRNFMNEQWEGTLSTMVLAGMNRLIYHLGCVLFSGLYALLEVTVLLITAILVVDVDVKVSQVSPLALLLAVLASFIGLYGLSLVLAALILYTKDRVVVEGVAFSLLNLVSGVLFPVQYLPLPLQWLGELMPLTWALKVLRSSVLGGAPILTLMGDLAILTALGAAYVFMGKWLLDRVVNHALESAA